MDSLILDGTTLARNLLCSVAERITVFVANNQKTPFLAVIIIGDNPASKAYVNRKMAAARQVDIRTHVSHFHLNTPEADVLRHIACLNNDPSIDGILVQLPLPPHINVNTVINAIEPTKDVDGFHPLNVGKLMDDDGFIPCTPKGIMKLLAAAQVQLQGADVIMVGCSALVGRPTALLLNKAKATVTIAHKDTRDLGYKCRNSEILIVAAGQPNLIRREHINRGSVVIDVGINRVDGRLVGDVTFDECVGIARVITPVPGGVGPMTVACLMENTLQAASERVGEPR